jgi:putative transposase
MGPRHGLSDQWRDHGSMHHSDRGSQGGFNRSSQHHALGGVDDDRKTEVGSVYAAQIVLAGSAASLAA